MAKKKYRDEQLVGPAPEPEGIVRKALGAGLSGLSAVGNLLDLPGSMVRDTAAGLSTGNWSKHNPFDQLLTPLRDTNRTTGRDLNRMGGLAGRKDTYGNWWGGLGTEIATDPLTYLSLGGTAVGKGVGTLMTKSGIHGLEAARIASKAARAGKASGLGPAAVRAGKAAKYWDWVGPREARQLLTPRMVEEFAPEMFDILKSTSKAQKGGAFDLANHMDDPMGALAKIWPLGDQGLIGRGGMAQKVARGLDVAGDFVRHAKIPGTAIRPIGDLANLVNSKAANAVTPDDLQAAYHLHHLKEGARAEANLWTAKWTNDLINAGHKDTDAFKVRDWFEFPQKAPPELQPLVAEVRQYVDRLPQIAKELGVKIGDVNPRMKAAGSNARYFMRQIAEGVAGNPRSGRAFDPAASAELARAPWTLGSKGGTKAIADMARDPLLERLITHGKNAKSAARYIKRRYGSNFPAKFLDQEQMGLLEEMGLSPTLMNAAATGMSNPALKDKLLPHDTFQAAAAQLKGMSPEVRKAGIYANHPINDFVSSISGTLDKVESSKVALDRIVDAATAPGPGTVSVKSLLGKMGLDAGDSQTYGAAKWLQDKGLQNPLDAHIPKETADFLTQMHEPFEGGPKTVHAMTQLYDDIANLTKVVFTNLDPIRFNVRNRVSGLVSNALSPEQFMLKAQFDADRVMRKQVVEGAAQNPFIIQEAARRGLKATDPRDVEQFRDLLKSHGNLNDQEADAVASVWRSWAEGYLGQDFGTAINRTMAGVTQGGPLPAGSLLQENAPMFYSKLRQVVDQKIKGNTTKEQLLATLRNAGVKEEEIADMGIDAAFDAGKPITKENLRDYLDLNSIEMKEVTKGGKQADARMLELEEIQDGRGLTDAEAAELRSIYGGDYRPRDMAKFDGYQIPGGENYREMLLQLPSSTASDPLAENAFRSGHWEEPNVLAHIRFSDRVDDAGKKVLHIEEIQSDWHQAGRKKGYGDGEEFTAYYMAGQTKVPVGFGKTAEEAIGQARANGWGEATPFVKILTESRKVPGAGIPDAPFKKSWHNLSMKRMIRYAAENGYDRIAWTPGVEQVRRYEDGFRKAVDEITWNPHPNPQQPIVVIAKKGGNADIAFGVDLDGNVTTKSIGAADFQGQHLSEVVGKEIANKILGQPAGGSVSGNELTVGGEGMKGFYDNILVNDTNKYIKKWGAKVGGTTVSGSSRDAVEAGLNDLDFADMGGGLPTNPLGGHRLHSFDITPAMRQEVVAKGQPLYQQGPQGVKGAVHFQQDGKAMLHAFQAADVSTHLHELSHVMRRHLTSQDQAIADAFVGAQVGGQWTTQQEEMFARGFENYIRTGQAPTTVLGQVFAKLKQWMTGIYQVVTGSQIDVQLTPEIKQLYSKLVASPAKGGQVLDDAKATDILREMLSAHEVTGSYGVSAIQHHTQPGVGGKLEDIIHGIPGGHPFSFGQAIDKLKGKGTTWNPLKAQLRGVGGAEKTTFAPAAFGEDVSHYTESMNRIAPFWALLQSGVHPQEAAKRVFDSQVAYQGRFYTKFEQQVLKRLFLFYSFSKGQVPFTLKQLMENPGGRLAQTLRGINRSKDQDELVPQHIAETPSIPLGTLPDGSKRYFTGLGLGFEDPLQFATPSAKNLGLEALSRANPLIKGPAEWVAGQSFFQRAPGGGGRELTDLDPPLGRILANVREMAGGAPSTSGPVRYPGSDMIEHMLANSPVSNLLTKARTITDPRKKGLPGAAAKASNLLTGFKVSDVSPAAQDRELRNRVQLIEKLLGAKTFTETFLPADVKAGLSPAEQAQAASLNALKKLLDERSKARKKK